MPPLLLRGGRPSISRRPPLSTNPPPISSATGTSSSRSCPTQQPQGSGQGSVGATAGLAVGRASGTAGRGRRVRRQVQVEAGTIGFDLPGSANSSKDAERTVGELLESAASLLLYRSAMQTRTSQAMLKLLGLIQKGSAPQLLDAYGDLYSMLAGAGFSSWQDYLLDQILSATNNAWAKSLAKHGPGPASNALSQAAAYDLDVLQKLAVTESTLVGWISSVSPGVPREWPAAAVWLPADRSSPKGNEMQAEAVVPDAQALKQQQLPKYIRAPLSDAHRREWRAHIGAKWRWSEALPELMYYYACHGCGLMSQYSTLQWSNGAFQAYHTKQADDNPVRSRFRFTEVYATQRNSLWVNLMRHMNGQPSNHVLAVGTGRSCQSYFLWDAAVEAAAGEGLRFLRMPPNQVGSLLELGRALGDHPRLRFVVVIEPLELEKGTDAYSAVLAALAGFRSSGWPDNALLLLSAYSPSDPMSDPLPDPLSELSRFPSTRLIMGPLSAEEYLATVTTLMSQPPSLHSDPRTDPALGAALQYGYQQGFSMRSAYEYALEIHLLGGHASSQGTAFSSSDDVQ